VSAVLAVGAVAATGQLVPARAQGQFIETFDAVGVVQSGQDGPTDLIDQGWIFRNQSEPIGSNSWFAGSFHTPQTGEGYLGADSLSADFFGGRISNWVILPDVSGQQAGDQLTLHLRAVASSNVDTIQVRYSPTGSKDTGSSSTDIGDFTDLLLDIDPLSTSGWVAYSVTLPGNGAIALRYFEDWACNWACPSSSIGLDTLSIGDPPAPGCNLPPVPGPGQTVTWSAAESPFQICSDLAIPAGTTVLVEAGTTIEVDPGRTLAIDGTWIVQGTAAAPVTIIGDLSLVTPPVHVKGLAELNFANVSCRIHSAHGGTLLVADSSFTGGEVSTDDSIGGPPRGTFVQVDRSSFVSGGVSVTDGTLAIRDTDITGTSPSTGAGVRVLRGYLLAENVTLDGGRLSLIRERYTQPAFLDGLTIRNVPGQAAADLYGWNFLLGPNNVFESSLYPVSLIGGLLTGSAVPTAGNTNNYVDVGNGGLVGTVTWAKLDVPYVVNGTATTSSALTIEPGATVQFTPGSGIIYTGSFRALGLPLEPILFQRFDPLSSWNRLKFASNSLGDRFRHCILEGADTAVHADNAHVQVESCLLRDNAIGGLGSTFGVLRARGTRFANNATGVETTPLGSAVVAGSPNANSFEGNALGVTAVGSAIDATGNWWGDPTGPQASSNPGGAGDPISGAVDVLPFLTQAPDFADAPPIVKLLRPYSPSDSGSKQLLSWEAQDDGAIQSQRILFSEHGNFGYTVVADNLPPHQRSFEWVVPVANPSSDNSLSFVKIVAVDDQGQEGFDETTISIPYTEDIGPASLTFTTDLTGPFTFGEEIEVCWTYTGPSATWDTSIAIGGDMRGVGYGGAHTGVSCWTFTMPYVSTDTARITLAFNVGAGGRRLWFFSDEFTVRPDPRIGDAPPAVTLLSPLASQVFAGGSTVPITWSAADDEGLRSFTVQASYDAARTWQAIAHGLPGSARGFDWKLPTSSGMADVRVRVVAADVRFQSSSDVVPIEIQAGASLGGEHAFCFGQAATCPCGNGGSSDTGCDNPQATGGVKLVATAFAPDGAGGGTAVLTGSGFPSGANPTAIVIRSRTQKDSPTPFGDGLLCIEAPVVRFGATAATGGQSTHAVQHGAGAGLFVYQLWYRSQPPAFCDPSAAFNTSSALELVWP